MSSKSVRNVVTIDGLAASGKSTLAKLLARELGFVHLNTGLLYRACALLAIKGNLESQECSALIELLDQHQLCFDYTVESGSRILVDGCDQTDLLESLEVANKTSKIAAIPELREYLKKYQSEAFRDRSIVAEGRDMGTVIFPQAPVKFFIGGDPQVRALRRARQLSACSGNNSQAATSLAELSRQVANELQERDLRDQQRAVAPLRPAQDAIVIDNSSPDIDATIRHMAAIVQSRISV